MKDNGFWAFSLWFYAQPGIEPLCLDLQHRYHADVNMLLFCVYSGMRGYALDGSQIIQIEEGISLLQQEIVEPMRALRWAAKKHQTDYPDFYDRIKSVELAAEKIVQDRIFAIWCNECHKGSRQSADKAIKESLRAYFGKIPGTEKQEWVNALALCLLTLFPAPDDAAFNPK